MSVSSAPALSGWGLLFRYVNPVYTYYGLRAGRGACLDPRAAGLAEHNSCYVTYQGPPRIDEAS